MVRAIYGMQAFCKTPVFPSIYVLKFYNIQVYAYVLRNVKMFLKMLLDMCSKPFVMEMFI